MNHYKASEFEWMKYNWIRNHKEQKNKKPSSNALSILFQSGNPRKNISTANPVLGRVTICPNISGTVTIIELSNFLFLFLFFTGNPGAAY